MFCVRHGPMCTVTMILDWNSFIRGSIHASCVTTISRTLANQFDEVNKNNERKANETIKMVEMTVSAFSTNFLFDQTHSIVTSKLNWTFLHLCGFVFVYKQWTRCNSMADDARNCVYVFRNRIYRVFAEITLKVDGEKNLNKQNKNESKIRPWHSPSSVSRSLVHTHNHNYSIEWSSIALYSQFKTANIKR